MEGRSLPRGPLLELDHAGGPVSGQFPLREMEISAYYCGEICYTVRGSFQREGGLFCGLSGAVSEKGTVQPVPGSYPGIYHVHL